MGNDPVKKEKTLLHGMYRKPGLHVKEECTPKSLPHLPGTFTVADIFIIAAGRMLPAGLLAGETRSSEQGSVRRELEDGP